MEEKIINITELNISIPLNDKKRYFDLLDYFQTKFVKDTYLLMDNLYEKNASCIDTYSLFVYLKKNNFKAKYVLYKKNPLYIKLKENNSLEDIIIADESSLTGSDLYAKLFMILCRTKYIILSFPDSLYTDLLKYVYQNKYIQSVMIGHGPVFFKTSILNQKLSNYLSPDRFNLYLVSSDIEKKIFEKNGWPTRRIINIGLPRFDLVKKKKHKTKNIFIMFTWRLDSFRNLEDVTKLLYFKNFKLLLENKILQEIAKTAGYRVIVGLHHSIKNLCNLNFEIPDCYLQADQNNLIDYINITDLFITDYSSIVHDFMFLNTPVIFYRLDYDDPLLAPLDKYDQIECKRKDNQIFNVFYNLNDVIKKILYYKNNDFKLENKYKIIENSFFTCKKNLCRKFIDYLEKNINSIGAGKVLEKKWTDVETAICVSSSNEYVPYLSVFLKSLIEHCESKKDIIIFNCGISNENKNKILEEFSDNNCSIRFFNPLSYFDNVNLYVSHDYFKEECYFRVVAPKVLSEHKKIIFTDLDIIVLDDILKLADIDMGDKPIAACIEPIWRELYIQNNRIYNTSIRRYTIDTLKLDNPFNYYNTGVVIFNVPKFNEMNAFEGILEIIKNNKLLYQEQCALNIFFKNNFITLPNIWNYELAPSLVKNDNRFDFYEDYKKQEKSSAIIHYLGRFKPWKNPLEYKAEQWWYYAKNTSFYEEILIKMFDFRILTSPVHNNLVELRKELLEKHFVNINNHFQKIDERINNLVNDLINIHFININKQLENNNYYMKLIYVAGCINKFRMIKLKYKLLSKLFTKNEFYKNKYLKVKKLLKDVKRYKKGYLLD